jgi:hypothetical protein
MQEKSFVEFIENICKRPAMYTGGSVKETLAFIEGYRYGNSTPISGRAFDRYVCLRYSFPTNYVWTAVINEFAKDDKDAMRRIEEIIIEFVRLKEKMSDDELIQYATEKDKLPGEPPAFIDGARVIKWAWSGEESFGYIADENNENKELIYGLAICQYKDREEIYRFSCDENWITIQDGLYNTIEEAIELLPIQYKNVSANWQTKSEL